ncbi:RluA family pseudouridine synthase [Sporosarcina contaminans]|uniref:Pseudouridine synthase n=2 Tax=Sporosarcina contaminans TaxID=633403 RepID=A0ABW3U033_9BACL
MMDTRFKLIYTVEFGPLLLREFLHSKGISKRTLTATKYEGGCITVNGTERTVRHIVEKGDVVTILFPPEKPSAGLIPQSGPLSIIYEDEAIMIIDKPAGQGTIPSRDQPDGTIANFVAGKFAEEQIPATAHVVTRLDTDTSGLICMAKNRHIHHLLSDQMIQSHFSRNYIALAEGHFESDYYQIEQPIGRKEGSIIERTVRADGQYARTDVTVYGRYYASEVEFAQIGLKLHTGRTHQIRVHMQWLGHPLLGDDLYGGSLTLIQRQALHCAELSFSHPLTGLPLKFSAPLPEDLQSLLIDQ